MVPAHGRAGLKPVAATLEVWNVTRFWYCSFGERKGWSLNPCKATATVHLTDAGGAPYCTPHAVRLFSSLLSGKRALGLDMELPPIMELLRTG